MKKIVFTLVVILFVFGTLFASFLGIRSFYIAQKQIYNMQQINVCITKKEVFSGRNSSLTLYAQDVNVLYEIPSVWYDEFDMYTFNNNFVSNKEYTLIINYDDIAENSDVVFVYGLSDEQVEYLSSEDSVSAEKANLFLGLVVGLSLLIGITVSMIIIFFYRRSLGKTVTI